MAVAVLLWMCVGPMAAQYRTEIQDAGVRTLRMRYADAGTGEPIGGNPERPYLIMENGAIGADGDKDGHVVEVSFDEMTHDISQYTYTVIHLDRHGQPDGLQSGEYLQGFTTRDITDYELSLNTARDYTHYRFLFPNEEMTLTASGNYAIVIYKDGAQDQAVATVCLSVVEPRVRIEAQVRSQTDIEFNGRYQQLDIDINGISSSSPATDYSLVVRQNGRQDNMVCDLYPTYVESNRLRFVNHKGLIFEGGNEYRHIDLYSTYIAGVGVDRIVYDHNDYHAILLDNELRGTGARASGGVVADKSGTPYIHEYDVNGQFVVNAERTDYDDSEAEYMWVHFALSCPAPWFDGSVYVGGDLFQNQTDSRNRMQYDNEAGCYYLNALVKQGGYDYQYWFVGKGGESRRPRAESGVRAGGVTLQRTEGSHWQTQNEYAVYVYFHPFGARYDQLVGVEVLGR